MAGASGSLPFGDRPFEDGPFEDGKAPDALRTIGEVATALGIRQHVLRYWEEQFPMLRPVKRSGGRRYYRPEDVALIARIDRMVHHEGFTLRGARMAIEAGGGGTVADVPGAVASTAATGAPAPEASSGVPVEALVRIRDRLAEALAIF